MNLSETLLAEFAVEAPKTRRLLERVPESQFGWTPHAKSMTMGRLASHIAENPGWAAITISQDEVVMDLASFTPYVASSGAELLKKFDDSAQAFNSALQGQTDAHLNSIWRMKIGDQVVIEMPRVEVLRQMILYHTCHHRGQLTVYLRMCDAAVPSLYGPTADEP